MDLLMERLLLKGIEMGAQAYLLKGNADAEKALVQGWKTAGLSLEQINTEMDAHLAKSFDAAEAALRAKGA